jgi:hypothetical protein
LEQLSVTVTLVVTITAQRVPQRVALLHVLVAGVVDVVVVGTMIVIVRQAESTLPIQNTNTKPSN